MPSVLGAGAGAGTGAAMPVGISALAGDVLVGAVGVGEGSWAFADVVVHGDPDRWGDRRAVGVRGAVRDGGDVHDSGNVDGDTLVDDRHVDGVVILAVGQLDLAVLAGRHIHRRALLGEDAVAVTVLILLLKDGIDLRLEVDGPERELHAAADGYFQILFYPVGLYRLVDHLVGVARVHGSVVVDGIFRGFLRGFLRGFDEPLVCTP